MRELRPEFAGAGITVRFITIGSQEKATSFCSQWDAGDECIGDAGKESYRMMGLEDFNLLTLFSNPKLGARRAENKAAGFKQNWSATKLKDAAQLPGAALIDSAGVVRWIHRGTHPGDLPPMRDLLNRARSLAAL